MRQRQRSASQPHSQGAVLPGTCCVAAAAAAAAAVVVVVVVVAVAVRAARQAASASRCDSSARSRASGYGGTVKPQTALMYVVVTCTAKKDAKRLLEYQSTYVVRETKKREYETNKTDRQTHPQSRY